MPVLEKQDILLLVHMFFYEVLIYEAINSNDSNRPLYLISKTLLPL